MKDVVKKNIIKKYSYMGVGLMIGLTIYDLIAGKEFTVSGILTRLLIVIVLYFIFGSMEYKYSKKEQ